MLLRVSEGEKRREVSAYASTTHEDEETIVSLASQ